MLLSMSAGKGKMINFRVSPRHAAEFKAACNAREKAMTNVLKDYVLRYIATVREADPDGFTAELSLLDDHDAIAIDAKTLDADGTNRNRRKA